MYLQFGTKMFHVVSSEISIHSLHLTDYQAKLILFIILYKLTQSVKCD